MGIYKAKLVAARGELAPAVLMNTVAAGVFGAAITL